MLMKIAYRLTCKKQWSRVYTIEMFYDGIFTKCLHRMQAMVQLCLSDLKNIQKILLLRQLTN